MDNVGNHPQQPISCPQLGINATPDNMLKCFKFCKPKGQEMDTLGNHPIENNPFPAHICQQLGINAYFWPQMMRKWGTNGKEEGFRTQQ